MRHTAGPLAGRPFLLDDWQSNNIVRPVFGALNRDGTRRYREAVVGLPRWQGKSQSVAGLGLACMFTEPTHESENYVVASIEEFKQNHVKMSAASMMLLDVLEEGRMRHGGHAELSDQVLNAGVQETPYGWRITKMQDDLKIDACVALVMAAYLAEAEAMLASEPHVITA